MAVHARLEHRRGLDARLQALPVDHREDVVFHANPEKFVGHSKVVDDGAAEEFVADFLKIREPVDTLEERHESIRAAQFHANVREIDTAIRLVRTPPLERYAVFSRPLAGGKSQMGFSKQFV